MNKLVLERNKYTKISIAYKKTTCISVKYLTNPFLLIIRSK